MIFFLQTESNEVLYDTTPKHYLQNRQKHYHKKVYRLQICTIHDTWARCSTILFGLDFPQAVLNMITIVILLTSNMITLLTLCTLAILFPQLFLHYVISTIAYSGSRTKCACFGRNSNAAFSVNIWTKGCNIHRHQVDKKVVHKWVNC